MHINDTKSTFISRQSIGKGNLGWKSFKHFTTDLRLDELPMIPETIEEKL